MLSGQQGSSPCWLCFCLRSCAMCSAMCTAGRDQFPESIRSSLYLITSDTLVTGLTVMTLRTDVPKCSVIMRRQSNLKRINLKVVPELQNVKSFTRTNMVKPDFTPRKARKSRHFFQTYKTELMVFFMMNKWG